LTGRASEILSTLAGTSAEALLAVTTAAEFPFYAESSLLCELSHIRGRSTANTL